MVTSVPTGSPESLSADVGAALRSVRHARSLSQRDLAHLLGVGKSTVARIEGGVLSGAVLLLHEVLGALGFELTVLDRRDAREAEAPGEQFADDEEATAIIACWRQRAEDEVVRDAAGRRLPAHLHIYPIRIPHRWWFARHPGVPWRRRPLWSYSRYVTRRRTVHRLGRFPDPVGRPPVGGAPMQGYPPAVSSVW